MGTFKIYLSDWSIASSSDFFLFKIRIKKADYQSEECCSEVIGSTLNGKQWFECY